MKNKVLLTFLLLVFLAGCVFNKEVPKQTEVRQFALTLSPSYTVIQTPIQPQTMEPTEINTLEPELAKNTIKTLLKKAEDCSAPCFWGIVPGITTVEEARSIFEHLGLQMITPTFEGKEYVSTHYVFENNFSFSVALTILHKIVDNLQVTITPEKQINGIEREWLAYSPETLIKRYGTPSKVDFFADWGPGTLFSMQLYFDEYDLIVQYSGNKVIPQRKGSSTVCPLSAQFYAVWIWMGKNPVYPPGEGVPLDQATGLSKEEFAKLMTNDPNNACFTFYGGVFP